MLKKLYLIVKTLKLFTKQMRISHTTLILAKRKCAWQHLVFILPVQMYSKIHCLLLLQ